MYALVSDACFTLATGAVEKLRLRFYIRLFRHRRRLRAISYVLTLYTIIVRRLHGLRKKPVRGHGTRATAEGPCTNDIRILWGKRYPSFIDHLLEELQTRLLQCGDLFKDHNLLPSQTYHLTDANVQVIFIEFVGDLLHFESIQREMQRLKVKCG